MKQKKIVLAIIAFTLIGGISYGGLHQQKTKAEQTKQEEKKEVEDTVKENQEDLFKTLSKAKSEKVLRLDKAVDKILTKKENHKPLDGLKEAEEALKALDVKDADLKTIHEAYSDVIAVIKDPNRDLLQDARTSMTNMEDAEVSEYMLDAYEDRLVKLVAKYKLQDPVDIEKYSRPLTPQQVQAEKEAKTKADKEAVEKAKADKEQVDKDAADVAAKIEAERVTAEQAEAAAQEPVYKAPAETYTPPANNNDGGYTPPANNDGVASSNDAANNTPTPQPSYPGAINDDISGTNNINGHELEAGGW